MKDIDKILITVSSLNKHMELSIEPNTLKCYVNGNTKDIKEDVIDRLLNIICLWDYEYVNNSIIDPESYEIRIYTSEGVDKYIGKGMKPKYYQEFLEIVGELYE